MQDRKNFLKIHQPIDEKVLYYKLGHKIRHNQRNQNQYSSKGAQYPPNLGSLTKRTNGHLVYKMDWSTS